MSNDEVIYCSFHPDVETRLRCSKCGTPICPRCAVQTPVGFRCPDCVRVQQAVFYTATPLDYAIAAVVGLVASTVAGFIMGQVGIFLSLILGGVAGGAIAEVIRWIIRRRRGRWMWLVVSLCIALGGFLSLFLSPANLITLVIYVTLAVGTAYARLK
jgi:hypothetical protein